MANETLREEESGLFAAMRLREKRPVRVYDSAVTIHASPAQERLWFSIERNGRRDLHLRTAALKLNNEIRSDGLIAAIKSMSEQETILRTRLFYNGQFLEQEINDSSRIFHTKSVFLTDRTVPFFLKRIQKSVLKDSPESPLIQFTLLEGLSSRYLTITYTQVLLDYESESLLFLRILEQYNNSVSKTNEKEKAIPQYRDYSQWLNEIEDPSQTGKELFLEHSSFSAAHRVASMQRELPGELLPPAKRYAEKLKTSLPLVFLSAFHQFLYAYTDLDIPLFIPASGRVRPELANMLGQFTIPIIFRPGCTAFDEAIHAAEQTMRVDFSKMRELYEAADRELSLCDVSPARFLYVREHSLPFPLIRLDPRLSFFPLSLLLTETGERIRATLQFSDRFIDSKGADLFIDFFSQFLLAKLSGITLRPSKKWHYPVRRKNKKSFNASNASTFTKQTIQTGADSHNSQRTQSIHLTVEDRIAQVFSDVLGRPCGRDDDFFRMGGSSLQAARILILLRKEENLSFSFADLIYCPTPARLAGKIDNVSSLCVKINSSTQATPLFIIHDQGGEIHGIVRLVSRLQYAGPIFAIRASGLVKNEPFDRSIHAMAKRYAAEIMKTQKGSCFIGGMCTGATIALETASILQQSGRTVEKLILLRPTPPLSLAKKTHYFKPIFRYFRSLTDFLSLMSKPFYKFFIFTNLCLSAQAGQRRVWSFFAKDLKNHSPLPFPGPAALIMSEEKLRTFPEYVKEWGYLVQGNLEIYSVPGSHYTMLQHPALDNFAEKLKLAIETKVKLS